MRLCIVSPSYYPATIYGGPIFSVHHSSLELAQLGVEVYVSTTNANGNKRLHVRPNIYHKLANGYNVKYYNDTVIGRFSFRFIIGIWRDIKRCDVVRVEDIFSFYIPPALLCAKLFKKPFMISPRGVLSAWSLRNKRYFLKNLWLTFFIKPFIRGCWWHATSLEESSEIKSHFNNSRIVMIPNGINLNDFSEPREFDKIQYIRRLINRKKNSHDGPVIISMGRLHRKKGFDILINAFNKVRQIHLDAVLLIAGADDGERHKLEQQVESLLLCDRVFFLGEIKGQDKAEFFASGDLFVLPSHSENFGNVYLEALASGVPVVASHGTPWSAVELFGCGKWVENSVPATASAMFALLAEDRRVMSASAKKMAKNYSWSHVAERFQETFKLMLDGSSIMEESKS